MVKKISLRQLSITDITDTIELEAVEWEKTLLFKDLTAGQTLLVDWAGRCWLVNASTEQLIAWLAKKINLSVYVNNTTLEMIDHRYSLIVWGRYQIIPTAGFSNQQKCWFMGHLVTAVGRTKDHNGSVNLLFKGKKEKIWINIDACYSTVRSQIQIADEATHFQTLVWNELSSNMGFLTKRQRKAYLMPPDHRLILKFLNTLVASLVDISSRKVYGQGISEEHRRRLHNEIFKVPTGLPIRLEENRYR